MLWYSVVIPGRPESPGSPGGPLTPGSPIDPESPAFHQRDRTEASDTPSFGRQTAHVCQYSAERSLK